MSDIQHQSLAAALVAAQAEMPAVEKDSTNPHFRSRFTSLDHLIAKTRPVLTRHGLVITQSPTHLEGAPALATSLLHESGESRTDVMPLLVGKNDMQGLGSAITYGKRYAWAAALGISADEDDDGEASAAQAERSEPAVRAAGSSTERLGAAAGAATPAAPGDNSVITEPQRKRLWAIAREHAVDEDTLRALVASIAGVESAKDIPRVKYDELVAAVEAESIPF